MQFILWKFEGFKFLIGVRFHVVEDTTTLFPNLNHDSIISLYTRDATKFFTAHIDATSQDTWQKESAVIGIWIDLLHPTARRRTFHCRLLSI